ncbi:D-alanyl-D-alanine carboxypeptidase [Frankia sp. AgB1.9]|uniref:D-alanyl-D-alanine carboxypeptidase family protein n=1 Tax=Frankia sp. AgB1.9 TaxID=1836968 RepID=UPI0019324F82|nr:serine hydrolase [Frankia sp. AgB1.9]MBL7553927.1 D-alanyl-D-alanine carboxypeptidase [Frankia sp. AgB1.9]
MATAGAAGRARLARVLVAVILAMLAPVVLLLAGGPAAAAPAGSSSAGPPRAGPPAGPVPPSALAVGAGATSLPGQLTSAGWLVADADTGQILAAKGADTRDLPASTMKILTALVVLPGLAPDLRVTVGRDAVAVDGTKVGLVPGQSYLVRDLATAMLIASGNDATVALVDAVGGRDAVVARMNALAASLGATDTHAVDPTGLDAPGQLSSVRDLAILGRAAIAQPVISRYLTIPRAVLPTPNGGSFEIQNHNLLLGKYPGTLGVKNGYTVAADATYVGAARRGGRTLVVALLRAAPNYAADARALLDWGFANDGVAAPVGMLPAPPPAPTVGDETRPTGVGLAGLAGGPVSASGADRHHEGSGPGWITWLALGATVLAGLLTAAGHRWKRVRARRHAQRARARHLAAARRLPPQRPGTGPRGRRRQRDMSGSGHRGR